MYNIVVSSNFSLMHALVWPFKLKLLPSCFYHWYDRDIIGSWSNDDGDINENGKKAISVDWQNNSSARASHFFSTFFAITAQLRCENASYFHVLWKTWTQHNDFLFLFLNFDTVFKNSTPEKIANIWSIERDGICVIKFEAGWLYFLSDIFIAIAVIVV